MTKEEKQEYAEADELRKILLETLGGEKYRLDCGHHITFGHPLGNNLIILNGTKLELICTHCGY